MTERGTLAIPFIAWLVSCACDSRDRTEAIHPSLAAAVASASTGSAGVSVQSASSAETTWDAVRLIDEIPLCVFASYDERGNALSMKDVRPQTLAARSKIVFGTFAPGCMAEACDEIPTEMCTVDAGERGTLVVHSLLSFRHKHGAVCTEDCRPIVAGCETDVLDAGTYTVKYGGHTFTLRVPSTIKKPCFEL
jgi:hypothetical protein